MAHNQLKNCNTIHLEVLRSYEKLTSLMGKLTEPDLVEHCKIWRIQKGAKMLIDLVIAGDKLLSRSVKTSSNMQKVCKKQEEYEMDEKEDLINNNGIQMIQQAKCKKEQFQIKKQQQSQSQQENREQSYQQIKKNSYSMNIPIKHQEQQHCIYQVIQQFQKSQQSKIKRKYSRGPYKNYTRQMKQRIVELYKSNSTSISKISAQFKVPIKNIKRWAENGVDRKEGAGRKRLLEPSLQKQLYEKIILYYPEKSMIQLQSIRNLALDMSNIPQFKASKGWLLSFIGRYKLDNTYHIV